MSETPDLRALLGDDYERVIEELARAVSLYDDAEDWTEYRREAERAAAAVLPDLLAEAWDEGFKVGDRYGSAVTETHAGYRDSLPVRPENPYRPTEGDMP